MKSTFQAGVDKLYNTCVAYESTPSSSTPDNIASAIGSIATAWYGKGVTDGTSAGYTNGYNVGYNAGTSAPPFILSCSSSCNQPYGTYNYECSASVKDAVSGTTLWSTSSKGSSSFSYNGRSYTTSVDGDTVYGEYSPWVSFTVYDSTKSCYVVNGQGATTNRMYWNGSSYQSI
jgi:hypothetical protein